MDAVEGVPADAMVSCPQRGDAPVLDCAGAVPTLAVNRYAINEDCDDLSDNCESAIEAVAGGLQEVVFFEDFTDNEMAPEFTDLLSGPAHALTNGAYELATGEGLTVSNVPHAAALTYVKNLTTNKLQSTSFVKDETLHTFDCKLRGGMQNEIYYQVDISNDQWGCSNMPSRRTRRLMSCTSQPRKLTSIAQG
ncbi:MAG: hypothetical protein IPL79_16880 [Myxococcales bacterium]|nr:hypothetical protein [Myxococcales bacterium]